MKINTNKILCVSYYPKTFRHSNIYSNINKKDLCKVTLISFIFLSYILITKTTKKTITLFTILPHHQQSPQLILLRSICEELK